MPTPTPIGSVHFDEPRAVVVREPENLEAHHSAIHGGINIYVDTLKEGQAILAAWPELMQQVSDYAQAILDDVRLKSGEIIAEVVDP